MEKGTMNTAAKHKHKAAPTTFDALIGELMPAAIHDRAAYGNAMEMVRRLAVIPGSTRTSPLSRHAVRADRRL